MEAIDFLGETGVQPDPDDIEVGLEVEREDSSEITEPFDPEKIKVRTLNVVVDQIVSRIEHEEIDLAPDFQRLTGVWDDKRKSRLIESLLLRIPIPVFYVAADENDKWQVVDGVQRISTIDAYVKGAFPLTQLEYLTQFKKFSCAELPRSMQRRIRETQLVMNVIEPGTPEEVKFNIFRRINTGGKPLNGQEIRHALHPGPVRDFLKALSETEEFLEATDRSINRTRMGDRECVLRFLAFHIDPWEDYNSTIDLDSYLGLTMEKINQMKPGVRAAVAEDFRKAMGAAFGIFGRDAFRKRYNLEAGRNQISRALFDVWSVGLARRSRQEITMLLNRRQEIISQFISLLNQDKEFNDAVSYSTSIPARIKKRFRTIDELIQRCL